LALTTLFGTAQLALQDALTRQLDNSGAVAKVPNFAIVSLRRDRFQSDNPGEIAEERHRFRADLEAAMKSFITANGWRVAGTGALVLNVVLRAITQDCAVQVRTVDRLYELAISDDAGERTVAVKSLRATVGREHESHSRGFIAVQDGARLVSREHLSLGYEDLGLTCRLLGLNPTTLNGTALGPEEVPLHDADVIECGHVRIVVKGLGS
jgi:hypothetical protein